MFLIKWAAINADRKSTPPNVLKEIKMHEVCMGLSKLLVTQKLQGDAVNSWRECIRSYIIVTQQEDHLMHYNPFPPNSKESI